MPPKPYTQGELVKSMKGVARFVTDPRLKQKLKDTTGIGTEATRANIISVLIARGYIVKKGRSIRASDAAFTLIDAVPAAIADPGTTAVWEQALDMIEAGQLTLDVFLSKQTTWISQLIAQYGSMSLSIKLPHGPACPQCGAPTRQRTGKSGPFWSCSRYPDCNGTLPVESGPPSVALRARVAAAAKAPDRLRFPWAAPCFKGVARVPHAPAGRPARNAFLFVCASVQPSPAAGPEGSFSANRLPRVLLVCVSLATAKGPRWLAWQREPPGDPLWSAVFSAGAHRRKTAPFVRGCAPDDAGPNHDMGRV